MTDFTRLGYLCKQRATENNRQLPDSTEVVVETMTAANDTVARNAEEPESAAMKLWNTYSSLAGSIEECRTARSAVELKIEQQRAQTKRLRDTAHHEASCVTTSTTTSTATHASMKAQALAKLDAAYAAHARAVQEHADAVAKRDAWRAHQRDAWDTAREESLAIRRICSTMDVLDSVDAAQAVAKSLDCAKVGEEDTEKSIDPVLDISVDVNDPSTYPQSIHADRSSLMANAVTQWDAWRTRVAEARDSIVLITEPHRIAMEARDARASRMQQLQSQLERVQHDADCLLEARQDVRERTRESQELARQYRRKLQERRERQSSALSAAIRRNKYKRVSYDTRVPISHPPPRWHSSPKTMIPPLKQGSSTAASASGQHAPSSKSPVAATSNAMIPIVNPYATAVASKVWPSRAKNDARIARSRLADVVLGRPVVVRPLSPGPPSPPNGTGRMIDPTLYDDDDDDGDDDDLLNYTPLRN